MVEYIGRVYGQIASFMSSLSAAKRAAMGATGFGIIAAIVMLFYWAGEKTYQPIAENMSSDDATNVMKILREKRIPFRVDPSGKAISVPPEYIQEFRMQMASMGVPLSSIVGNELFDKQALGTTSFVHKINQKRALEGELMRTIKSIKGVKSSRVHLAMAQKSAFIEDQKKSTASVVIELEPGSMLSERQVFGIGNLVAKAVEGMDTNDVVVMDANGKVLSKNASDPLTVATASQVEFRQKMEQEMEKRIEAMLSRVVGEGRVVARIAADLDFSQVNEVQTTYDQDGAAVRSEQKDQKSMEGSRPGPVGAAGAASNLPGDRGPAATQGVKTDTKTENVVKNYDVPQTVRRTTKPVGSIKKLSVAVLMDGRTVKTTGADGKVQSKVEPWPADKVLEFEKIITGALGIDRKRGDVLEIKNMEFTHEDFDEASRLIEEKERKNYIQNMIVYGVIGLTILLFFLLVVRPFIKWITDNTVDSVDTFLPQTIEELEKLQKGVNLPSIEDTMPVLPEKMDPEKVEGEMIREKIVTLVDSNPHKAALILKDWLHDPKKKMSANAAAEKEAGKAKTA